MINLFKLSLRTVKFDFDIQVEALEQFLIDIERFSQLKSKELESRVDKLVEESDEPELIYDHFADDFQMYAARYKSIACNSILVMVCALYESFLKDFALQVESYILGSESLAKMTVMYPKHYIGYIAKWTKLDFSSLSDLEDSIYPMVILRNKIIHYSTNLLHTHQRVEDVRDYDILTSIPFLKIDLKNGEYYITDQKLVLDFIENIRKHFTGYYQLLLTVDPALTKKRD